MALLEVEDLHTYYGNIHALSGVSLQVEEGEIVALIGANGAGKSTTLNTISGIVRPRHGSVRLDGRELDDGPAARRRDDGRRPGARGPPDVRPAHRPGEPPDGRLHAREATRR